MSKKCATALSSTKQPSLSSHNENEDSEIAAEGEDQRRLPCESSEDKSTSSSLDTGRGRRAIPSIRVTSQDGEVQAASEFPNQSNTLNQSNGQEATPTHSQLNQSNRSSHLNGSDRRAISVENGGVRGHLFTEEEVQSLQRQITDLQVDLEQLLQYTHVSWHMIQGIAACIS